MAGNGPRRVNIVIGAGPGGILCSHELSSHADVILLEQGGVVDDEITNNPNQWGTAFSTGQHTCHHETVPQLGLLSRMILYPFGASVGGSSNINAMIWTGGHPAVFDNYWPIEWNSKRFVKLLERVRELVQPSIVRASNPIASILNSVNLSSQKEEGRSAISSPVNKSHPLPPLSL
jgi:choline dehydrogenase-like flavoprotein